MSDVFPQALSSFSSTSTGIHLIVRIFVLEEQITEKCHLKERSIQYICLLSNLLNRVQNPFNKLFEHDQV